MLTKSASGKNTNTSSNKYSGILIAITLFLIFNLSVLALNFYTSSGIEGDAVSINLSGRQRMLSQRTAKVLLGIQYEAAQGRYHAENVTELNKVVGLFDTTLTAFKTGGTVTGGNEKPVNLKAVTTTQEKQIVEQAIAIWLPYKALVTPIMVAQIPSEDALDLATNYANANNLKLLKLMNDLTTSLETSAKAKSSKLQLIQTIALVLSLILFANIVFNALRKLRASDKELEKAQRENAEILGTVKEGLFLLDSEFNIGSQFSSSLPKVLQKNVIAGMPFMPVLQEITSPETYQSAFDYITLLFGSRVKENLVISLNPLSEIKVKTADETKPRYLSFQFNRVVENKVVLHLLVTVQDVTEQVTQAHELTQLKGQSNINAGMLNSLLQNNQTQIEQFLHTSELGLSRINELLATGGQRNQSPQDLINQCFRVIHSIKGEAATLGIISVETSAHLFEKHLVEIRDKQHLEQTDILSLPIKLTDLFKQISDIRTTFGLLHQFIAPESERKLKDKASNNFTKNMLSLAERVSANQNKKVSVQCNLELLNILDQNLVNDLHQVSIQLLRNSITHGIESPDVRAQKGKSAIGKIIIDCSNAENDSIVFSIRDDGQGISPERIKASLLSSGKYTEAVVNALSPQQIMEKLFEPGFSTASITTTDGGHGVGLDVVKTKIKAIGGELKTFTKVDEFTQFVILLPNPALSTTRLLIDAAIGEYAIN